MKKDDIPDIPPVITNYYIMIPKTGLEKWKKKAVIEYLENVLKTKELLIVEKNILISIIDKLKEETK